MSAPTQESVRVGAAGLLSRLAAPALTAAAVTGSFLLVHLVDPHQPGSYPVCPTWSVMGVFCPLCGGLRAANDLTHGDVSSAASSNLLVVLLVPLAVMAWLRWTWARARGRERPLVNPTNRQMVLVGIAMLAFAVLRNLPWGTALAP